MKAALLLLIFVFSIYTSFGQVDSSSHKHTNLAAYFIELEQVTGRDSIVQADSFFSYKIIIPSWWHIKETPSTAMFGGVFPAVDNIQNALLIKAYTKKEYKNFEDFENWVIKKYSIGQKPAWSVGQQVLLKKELDDFKTLGKAYKVQHIYNGLIYYCCYVLVETKTAYLWIDFTATQTTYDKNFPKFAELMSLFSKIE